jgi:hypothetical protein
LPVIPAPVHGRSLSALNIGDLIVSERLHRRVHEFGQLGEGYIGLTRHLRFAKFLGQRAGEDPIPDRAVVILLDSGGDRLFPWAFPRLIVRTLLVTDPVNQEDLHPIIP